MINRSPNPIASTESIAWPLLVLKVLVRAVTDVMGWSEASMASRYMHVPDELRHEIAGQVAGLLWSSPAATAPYNDERVELTHDQRAAIRLIASALPRYCCAGSPTGR
jgi:hypothetical protein